jgi:SpoVK/Ycf46/Vps4 family AAA+-type ATPase
VHESGGATSGMLGTLLTWLNDRTSEAIVVATANSSNLPSAFLRAGRFDAQFYFDFPSFNERKEIIQIMNKKWNSNLPLDDDFINSLVEWSGAEIEQLAKDSLFEDYKEAALGISLVKETKKEQVNEIRKFGETIRKANKGSMTKGLFNKKRSISIKEEEIKKDFGIDESFKEKMKRTILNKEK